MLKSILDAKIAIIFLIGYFYIKKDYRIAIFVFTSIPQLQ